MYKFVILRFLRAFFSLLVAGCFIGYFHSYDKYLLVFLIFVLFFYLFIEFKKDKDKTKFLVLLSGTVVCGVLGSLIEVWGIANNYWTYHNLSDNRQFPYWLPLAWGLTFLYFFRFEETIFRYINFDNFKDKLYFILVVSAILPTWGEIITIYLGVWTYNWPYKFFGVPPVAILLLMIFHSFVFLTFSYVCKKYKIKVPVFNP